MHSLSFDARNTTFHKTLYAITRQVFESEQNIFQMEKKQHRNICVLQSFKSIRDLHLLLEV